MNHATTIATPTIAIAIIPARQGFGKFALRAPITMSGMRWGSSRNQIAAPRSVPIDRLKCGC